MKWVTLFSLLFTLSFIQAQTYQNGWVLSGGLSSPRIFGDVSSEVFNFGLNGYLQYDVDEANSFRSRLDYMYFTWKSNPYVKGNPNLFTGYSSTNTSNVTIAWSIDYLYNFAQCNLIHFYGGGGASVLYYKLNKENKYREFSVNFIFGSIYPLTSEFALRAEVSFHQVTTDFFDGLYAPGGGLFGGTLDSYLIGEFGWLWYIDRGPVVQDCNSGEGLFSSKQVKTDNSIDYSKIEDLFKKYSQPATIVDYNKIEDIVKRNAPVLGFNNDEKNAARLANPRSSWVLIGINFDGGKSTFRPEAFPLLINAAQILVTNPTLKVQIEGHTDNVGSVASNQKLSEIRAEQVKKFLISKGIDESRLSIIGFGATKPISDNKSAQGKAFNRRIEFKVVE